MKAVLKFDLDDESDKNEFRRCNSATDAFILIESFDSDILRNAAKYETFNGRHLTESEVKLFEEIRDLFYQYKEKYNINSEYLE